MKILCIKTTNITSDLVLRHSLYYSHIKPVHNYGTALILGEAKGQANIPALAETQVVNINKCQPGTIHPAFPKNNKWIYEWQLNIHNSFNQSINILNYVYKGSQAYKDITSCQVFIYIDDGDFIKPFPIKGFKQKQKASKSSMLNPNNNTNPVQPLKKKYSIGDYIEVSVKIKSNKVKGKIIGIQDKEAMDSNGKKILVDQILTVELPDGKTKQYLASKFK